MKYAVVTGGTKGIGRSIVERFLKEGYGVITNYSSDDSAADELIECNKAYKDNLYVIKLKLSSYDDACLFSEYIHSITKCVTVLVLNVGITDRSNLRDITRESWENVINTNINAPFFLVQKLDSSIQDECGRIIFIGSICGVYPHSYSIPYGVTKAAIHQMAKELVKFFCDRRITVNAIIPGFVDTPRQLVKTNDQRMRIESKIALNRFGTPEEVSSLCMEIVSNGYINGANIEISGGYCFE